MRATFAEILGVLARGGDTVGLVNERGHDRSGSQEISYRLRSIPGNYERLVFCVGLFPENGCRFFLNDGGRDPIISGPSVVQNRFMLSPTSAWCPVSAVQPSVQAPQPLTPQRHGKNAEHTQGSLPKKWGGRKSRSEVEEFL